jgi:hypothetical protein
VLGIDFGLSATCCYLNILDFRQGASLSRPGNTDNVHTVRPGSLKNRTTRSACIVWRRLTCWIERRISTKWPEDRDAHGIRIQDLTPAAIRYVIQTSDEIVKSAITQGSKAQLGAKVASLRSYLATCNVYIGYDLAMLLGDWIDIRETREGPPKTAPCKDILDTHLAIDVAWIEQSSAAIDLTEQQALCNAFGLSYHDH